MDVFDKLRQMNILLIDDDVWIRDSLSTFFENERCRLHTLESAEEGLRDLERHRYDLILADQGLPGISGLEFLGRIHNSRPDIMTVLITAYGNGGIIAAAGRLGIYNCLQKPFTSEALEEALSRAIFKDKQGRALRQKTTFHQNECWI